MQSFLFSSNFVARMTPHVRNVYLRYGIFYYRQQLNGNRVAKSLHTLEPYTAVFLLMQILSPDLFNAWGGYNILTIGSFSKYWVYMKRIIIIIQHI